MTESAYGLWPLVVANSLIFIMQYAMSRSSVPWYVIPANHKWYARCAVANILVTRLQSIDLKYPETAPAVEEKLRTLIDPLGRSGTASRP